MVRTLFYNTVGREIKPTSAWCFHQPPSAPSRAGWTKPLAAIPARWDFTTSQVSAPTSAWPDNRNLLAQA